MSTARPIRTRTRWFLLLVFTLLASGRLAAFQVPEPSGLREKEFRHRDLDVRTVYRLPIELPQQAGRRAAADLAALGLPADRGRLDLRGGRWVSITLTRPLVPGRGVGNGLSWADLELAPPADEAALGAAAGQAFRGYLRGQPETAAHRPWRADRQRTHQRARSRSFGADLRPAGGRRRSSPGQPPHRGDQPRQPGPLRSDQLGRRRAVDAPRDLRGRRENRPSRNTSRLSPSQANGARAS